MDPQVQASFIPKKPLDTSVRTRGVGVGLFFLLSLVLFIASLVSAGAAFAYTQYLHTAVVSKSESLERAEGAYDPGVIQDLIRMDARINSADKLLNKHVSASTLFAFISTQTLEQVAWSSFEYSLQTDGSATISMSGLADTFSSVALQSDQLGGNKLLKDVIFSGIGASTGGGISFGVKATVDPSVLLYTNSLKGEVPGSVPTTSDSTVPESNTSLPPL